MSASHHPFNRPVKLQDPDAAAEDVVKVGIVPFIVDRAAGRHEKPTIHVMVMKPRADKLHLGPPPYQLAKGTRQMVDGGVERDMREEDLRAASPATFKTLADTAKREGGEELGLKESNVRKVYDMGVFHIDSASAGKKKAVHMFAAEIIDPKNFGPYESTTAETRWMTGSEFGREGRSDHSQILQAMLGRLERAAQLEGNATGTAGRYS